MSLFIGISQTDDSLSFIHSPQWCTLAYWEYRNRVGRLFPVYNDEINVFSHSPQGEGLCLEPLFSVSNAADDEAVQRTRAKIGFGITIRRDENGVWVYNRSKHAVFVDSPTLDPPNAKKLSVIKIMPGYSILAFDFACAQRYQLMSDADARDGPFDSYAFRISFAKGWGPDYTRQYITSCPCWLEVLLTSNLRY